MKIRSAVLAAIAAATLHAQAAAPPAPAKDRPLPRLVKQDGRYALFVDGAPYLMLGKPSTGMSRRWRRNALRNDGLDATVSARALNIRFETEGSFAQDGTRPHRYESRTRPAGGSVTPKSVRWGPRFQLGCASVSTPAASAASKRRASRCGGVYSAMRPHIVLLSGLTLESCIDDQEGGMADAMHQERWLAGDAYDALRAVDFQRFCTAARTDLTAHVPTCPEWDVAGLCDHLARVYQGRSYIVANGEFLDSEAFELRAEGEDPVAWVQRWSDELDRALLGQDDDAPTVTFMPDATTMHFWRRRMALETIVHRTDAEIAVGDVTSMDDELSADGVDEMLWFFSDPRTEHTTDAAASRSVVELTDGTRSWLAGIADAT